MFVLQPPVGMTVSLDVPPYSTKSPYTVKMLSIIFNDGLI